MCVDAGSCGLSTSCLNVFQRLRCLLLLLLVRAPFVSVGLVCQLPASHQLLLSVSAGDRCVVRQVAASVANAAGLVVVESAAVAEHRPMENEVGCCNTALSCSLFGGAAFQSREAAVSVSTLYLLV